MAHRAAKPSASDRTALPPVIRPVAARVLGMSERTFTRHEARGTFRPVRPGRGRRPALFDLAVLVPAILQTVETPRDRKDRSQAELNELRLARERRELLPRDQVVREGVTFITAAVAKLRALPNHLVRAGLLAAEAEQKAAALVADALGELARWRTDLDLLAAVDEKS
jgi:hypothetical protein